MRSERRVAWGNVQILEFQVGYSATAVPPSGGPPLGLVGTHPIANHLYSLHSGNDQDIEETNHSNHHKQKQQVDMLPKAKASKSAQVTELVSRSRSSSDLCTHDCVGWFSVMDRVRLLTERGHSLSEIASFCEHTRVVNDQRAESASDAWNLEDLQEREDAVERCCDRLSSLMMTELAISSSSTSSQQLVNPERHQPSEGNQQCAVVMPMTTGHSLLDELVSTYTSQGGSAAWTLPGQKQERKKVVLFEGF